MMGKGSQPRVIVVSSNIPPAHTGAGLAALKYATRLEAKGALAFLLTATEKPEAECEIGDERLMHVLRERTFRTRKDSREKRSCVWSSLGNLLRGIRTIGYLHTARKDYEIVHCFSPTWLSLFAVLAGKLLGKKVVLEITLAGGDCPESAGNNRFPILHYRRKIQFKVADAIVCLSPLLQTICRRSGLPERKLFVVPRAVDLARFRPVAENRRIELRSRLGLPDSLTLILYVGGIIPRKGIDLLLPAFRKIAATNPQVGLVIVGPSHKSDEAIRWHEEIISAKQDPVLQGRLFYPGWQMNVHEYMQACDLFALPSRREGFGNVFIEALASGLPVVCLKIEGLTDYILEDDAAGICVDLPNSDALATSLAKVIDDVRADPSLVRSTARNNAQRRFSHDRIDADYEKIYRKVLARPEAAEHMGEEDLTVALD